MNNSLNKNIDLIHYKLSFKIKDILKIRDHQNIIVSGPCGSGKSTLINEIFKEKFGNTKIKINDKYSFMENKSYYIFDLNKTINKYIIINFIKEISSKYDHYNDLIKYIIIENFNNISTNIQNSIKVLIEKKSCNARFILITNKIENIINSLKGNCMKINVLHPSPYDKYIYLKSQFNGKINFNDFLLLEDCRTMDLNIIINKYKLDCDFINIYNDFCYNFIDFLLEKLDVNFLRELIITIKNIDINLEKLLSCLIDKLIFILNNKTIIIVIKEISKYNYIINNSYRDIISIESLFVRLYKIINYERLL